MCELKALQATGIVMAVFVTIAGMGTEGFYGWKMYELNHCNTTDYEYEPCFNDRNQSDVCYHDDLEMRSYVGLVEGIVGTIAGICFIIGFSVINLPLIWMWVMWALGITSYNAYCIYDYYTTINDYMTDCIPDDQFWDDLIYQDYGYFFITVLTSVCCYGLALLVTIPVASVLTHMVGPDSTMIGSYELQDRKRS